MLIEWRRIYICSNEVLLFSTSCVCIVSFLSMRHRWCPAPPSSLGPEQQSQVYFCQTTVWETSLFGLTYSAVGRGGGSSVETLQQILRLHGDQWVTANRPRWQRGQPPPASPTHTLAPSPRTTQITFWLGGVADSLRSFLSKEHQKSGLCRSEQAGAAGHTPSCQVEEKVIQ